MIDLNNIWIGERLKILSTGEVGTFEGSQRNKVRIKIHDHLKTVSIDDVILLPEDTPENLEIELNESEPFQETTVHITKPSIHFSGKEIDLHINKLNPDIENKLPVQILEYQVDAAQKFLDYALQKRYNTILIIHGKGKGQLKNEIQHLLNGHPQVRWSFLVNGGGASEVYLKY